MVAFKGLTNEWFVKEEIAKGKEPNPDDAPYRPQKPGGPPWPGYPNPMPPGAPPTKLAGASFDIDPAGHKKAGKTQKIYNKATDKGAGGSEKQWIQKTGPQLPLPLAQLGLPIELAGGTQEMDQVYKQDAAKYGPSDARIKGAVGDKDKLLDAARQHPDRV